MKAFCGVLVLLLLCAGVPAVMAEEYAYVGSWGGPGSDLGKFTRPWGIAVDRLGNVYVTEYSGYSNHRVQRFASDGTLLGFWGFYGAEDGGFMEPKGVAVDGACNVYVASINRIQKFFSNGYFITGFGSGGDNMGELKWPGGVALHPSGHVYVADSGNNRVQAFAAGAYIAFLEWGDLGDYAGWFDNPQGIAVDADGYVYVADSGNQRVQKFTAMGTFVDEWGDTGYDEGEFQYPAGIAVDADGDVYVTDSELGRVQKFSASGTYITGWGVADPWGIAVDTAGSVYVVSRESSRVMKYAPALEPDFTAVPTSGVAPLTVQFTDATTNGVPDSWTWNFGDGQISHLKNPTHTYTEPGEYDVYLEVSSTAQGTNGISKNDCIKVYPPLEPDFTADPHSGHAPLTVKFTDATTNGVPDSWTWTFGDGWISHLQNPSHIYAEEGSYDVTLTVSSPTQGSRTKTKTDIIRVFPPLEPDFTAAPRTGFEPLTVQFTDTTTGGSHVCLWEFGDGKTSLVINSPHVYQQPGEYTVKLTVTSAELGGTTSVTKTTFIHVLPLWNGLMRI
jgi:PKD repeat protein